MPANTPQTLLIDADDTLWENNIYFEQAIAKFISHLNHQEFSAAQVRQVLNEVERECILSHGYGLHSFAHALIRTFEQLAVDPVSEADHERIRSFAHEIAEHPVEIIAGVPETLAYLSPRHHMIVVTKGDFTEQSGKIERSGLKEYFAATEIVSEKNAPTYHGLVSKYGLSPDRTWMIGNSPKSDINPALAAGLNAVFVPHADTWILEHEELASAPNGQELLKLSGFAELQDHF